MGSGHICWERHVEGPASLGKGGGRVSECAHRALLEHDLPETPAEPLLEGLPGVDQAQGLNQGKVLPHVPTQRLKERRLLRARRGGG